MAAYTDVYFQYIPVDGDLTTAEKLEGWMVSHLADNTVVKKKVQPTYGGVEHMQLLERGADMAELHTCRPGKRHENGGVVVTQDI